MPEDFLADTANLPALASQADTAASADPETLPAAPPQFTREQQYDFLEALARGGNVRAATRAAAVSRSTAYRMRRACPRFARLWNAALVLARPRVEAVLADRALNGVEETIFYHGEAVATRTRYDSRLLLAHLARLDRLAGDVLTADAVAEFDLALDDLLDEPEMEVVWAAPRGAEAGG